jgi:hypothetical protein
MGSGSSRFRVNTVEACEEGCETVDEGLQELPSVRVGDSAGIVDQSGLEGYISLATHDEGTDVAENLAQMLLRDRRRDRARRGARDGRRLPDP